MCVQVQLIIYKRNYYLLAVLCWGEEAPVNVPVFCETLTHISYMEIIIFIIS